METEKRAQRAICRNHLQGLSARARGEYSATICAHLQALPALQSAKTILSYRSTELEADLSAFHAWAAGQGKTLAFPVSYPGGQMEAYAPLSPESWERGWFGIWCPVPERSRLVEPEELDVVILPCVGFDAQGRRLGHGGGYYDRYLPRCPQATRVLAAFEVQRLEAVVTDENDQSVDVLVTEQKSG